MKVFLSSTFRDLIKHREATASALERLALPSGRMEVFGARAEEPLTASLEEIDTCDLFIGVYAHRYGFTPPGTQKSITELEYDHAAATDKTIFCFIVDAQAEWDESLIEREPGKSLLQQFLSKKIRTRHVPDTFRTADDLAAKVATAVGRYLIDEAGRLAKERHSRALDITLAHEGTSATVWVSNVGTHVIRDVEINAIPADDDWFERTHGPLPRLTSSGHKSVELTYPILGGWFHARVDQLSPNRGVGLATLALTPKDYTQIDIDAFWNDHAGLQRKSHGMVDVRLTSGSVSMQPRR